MNTSPSKALARFAEKRGKPLHEIADAFSQIAEIPYREAHPTTAFHCSKQDKPFTIRFKKTNGIYRLEEIMSDAPPEKERLFDLGAAVDMGEADTSLDIDKVSFAGFECPHCKANWWWRCGGCKRFICDGNQYAVQGGNGKKMQACPCGNVANSGKIGSLKTVEVAGLQQRNLKDAHLKSLASGEQRLLN